MIFRSATFRKKNMIDSRFPISVEEVIASGLIAESPGKEEMRRRVSEVTKLMGLENHSSQTIGNLSGGQLQRALFRPGHHSQAAGTGA